MARAKDPTILPPEAGEPSPESPGNRIIPETVSSDLSIRTEVSDHLVVPARERLGRMLNDLEAENARIDKRLSDTEYVQRAPAEVIARDRNRAAELGGLREKLRQHLRALA
jgi:valyl-tRNA synthetase